MKASILPADNFISYSMLLSIGLAAGEKGSELGADLFGNLANRAARGILFGGQGREIRANRIVTANGAGAATKYRQVVLAVHKHEASRDQQIIAGDGAVRLNR